MSYFAVSYDPYNYMETAFAPAEAKYKAQIMWHTWGHLHPSAKAHPGWMIFIHGTHGDTSIVDWKFKGVEGNPWTFDHMNEYIEWATSGGRWKGDTRRRPAMRVGVYRFTGDYVRLKNGNGRFRGVLERIHIPMAH